MNFAVPIYFVSSALSSSFLSEVDHVSPDAAAVHFA